MTDAKNDTSITLIRTLVENLSGPVVDWDNWESMTIIIDSYEGKFNSASGYLYSSDGTISAVAADAWKVMPAVDEYVRGYYKPGEPLPIKLLVQYDRTSGKYAITFEDTDEMRWKVTPRNIKTIREDLRPTLNESTDTSNPQEEVIFTRQNRWIPYVIRRDGALYLEIAAGANSNHDPRTFTIPISEAHFDVIRSDFARHLLLWSAILPLCDAAGTRDPIDDTAAAALLDPILLGSEAEVEALFTNIAWYDSALIAHHADIELLEQGKLFAALQSATEESDTSIVTEYHARRNRERQGIHLSSLDEAVLRYTGQYLHGGGIPSRKPDAVNPELLAQVLEIVTTAEQACADMKVSAHQDKESGRPTIDKQEWDAVKSKVDEAVRHTYSDLADEAVNTISFLMCTEAWDRARKTA